jgi:hypothetical protein
LTGASAERTLEPGLDSLTRATAQFLPHKVPVLLHGGMLPRAGNLECAKRFAAGAVAADITGMVALLTLSAIPDAAGEPGEAIGLGRQAVPPVPGNAERRLHAGARVSDPAAYHVGDRAGEPCRLASAATGLSRHPGPYRLDNRQDWGTAVVW